MIKHLILFLKEIHFLIRSSFFIMLTIVGNSFILLCGLAFWNIEHEINPNVVRYMDGVWWAYATATTTGYGDITPVTDIGKLLSIFLMLIGLALFAMYTALFAETIITNKNIFFEEKNKSKNSNQKHK